jgi:hypothetical protein
MKASKRAEEGEREREREENEQRKEGFFFNTGFSI